MKWPSSLISPRRTSPVASPCRRIVCGLTRLGEASARNRIELSESLFAVGKAATALPQSLRYNGPRLRQQDHRGSRQRLHRSARRRTSTQVIESCVAHGGLWT